MAFLVLVAGLLLFYAQGSLPALQRDDWFRVWTDRLSALSWLNQTSFAVLILSIVLPVLAVALMLAAVSGWFLGLFAFVLNLLVFLYSLGRGNLRSQVTNYEDDLKRADLQAAFHDAAVFNPAHREGSAENWAEFHAETLKAIPYRYFERHFAVIFWFLLAGAPGALAYRLAALHLELDIHRKDERLQQARHVLWILEWIPARVLGLSFALVGNFGSCFREWREYLFCATTSTAELLYHYVVGALGLSPAEGVESLDGSVVELEAVDALFDRALILWICLAALSVVI